MGKLKIAIVEDEMINAETLHDMLEDLGYEVYGKYMRAEKAWEAFQNEQPDFALLDIRLKGEKTGIWLAEQIKSRFTFPHIFLTSFGDKETVEKAAKTSAYGYLMKPVEKQNLHASIEVAMHKYAEVQALPGSEPEDGTNVIIDDALFIKDEFYYSKVKLSEILYIKSDDNYLELHTANKKHLVRGVLKLFLEKLPKQQFLQTHRSYIVNKEFIDGLGANFVKIGEVSIPVSRGFQESLKTHFNIF